MRGEDDDEKQGRVPDWPDDEEVTAVETPAALKKDGRRRSSDKWQFPAHFKNLGK